jgi:hypothetical protein
MFSVDDIQQRINVVNKRHCTSHSSGLSQALVCAECCLQRKWLVTLDDKIKIESLDHCGRKYLYSCNNPPTHGDTVHESHALRELLSVSVRVSAARS